MVKSTKKGLIVTLTFKKLVFLYHWNIIHVAAPDRASSYFSMLNAYFRAMQKFHYCMEKLIIEKTLNFMWPPQSVLKRHNLKQNGKSLLWSQNDKSVFMLETQWNSNILMCCPKIGHLRISIFVWLFKISVEWRTKAWHIFDYQNVQKNLSKLEEAIIGPCISYNIKTYGKKI